MGGLDLGMIDDGHGGDMSVAEKSRVRRIVRIYRCGLWSPLWVGFLPLIIGPALYHEHSQAARLSRNSSMVWSIVRIDNVRRH